MDPKLFVALAVLMVGEWISVEGVGKHVLFVCWLYVIYIIGRYLFARVIRGRTDVPDPFGFD